MDCGRKTGYGARRQKERSTQKVILVLEETRIRTKQWHQQLKKKFDKHHSVTAGKAMAEKVKDNS